MIVEDSVSSGKSLNDAREKIDFLSPCADKCMYLSVYVTPEKTSIPDIYFEIVSSERIFQWNFLTHSYLENCCIDIDGVLCFDPTSEENDDGKMYINFIRNAKAKLIPQRPVGYIVTSRLDKYRNETEDWLKRFNIDYKDLYMMNISTAEERRRLGNHAAFKAKVYKRLNHTKLFIESDDSQAREIFALTNKPVFCVDSQKYYSNERREFMNEFLINNKNNLRNSLKEVKFLYSIYNKIKYFRGARSKTVILFYQLHFESKYNVFESYPFCGRIAA